METVADGPAGDPRMGHVAALARRLGPRPWSDAGRRPPRPLDPAATPAVVSWLVDVADSWWRSAGRPDPWTLVVVSADEGELATGFLALGPECLTALRYVLVDPTRAAAGGGADAAGDDGPGRRAGPPPAAARRLALEEPAFLYPPGRHALDGDADPDEPPPPMRGIGPLVTWLAEIPVAGDGEGAGPAAAGAVVAVGEVSSLPVDAYEWRDGAWWELRLAAAGPDAAGLEEIAVPAVSDPRSVADHLLPAGPAPGRHEVPVGAAAWMRAVLSSAWGHLAVVDEPAAVGPLARLRPPARGPEPVAAGLAAAAWRIG